LSFTDNLDTVPFGSPWSLTQHSCFLLHLAIIRAILAGGRNPRCAALKRTYSGSTAEIAAALTGTIAPEAAGHVSCQEFVHCGGGSGADPRTDVQIGEQCLGEFAARKLD